MKGILLFLFTLGILECDVLAAQTLNEWLFGQIRLEEKILADALSQTGGRSLQLLRESRNYVPFFLEAPDKFMFSSTEQKALFDAWKKDNSPNFLPGGYVYRLRFVASPPLYATSAGDWNGNTWHSLDLDRDFTVEPSRIWNGSRDEYLFSTMLAGANPRIVVYDRRGYIKREEAFDANAKDFDQRVTIAEQGYSQKGMPALELLSLVEYLKNPDALWREVDLSGQFNLRNQQLRSGERERLESKPLLRRMEVVQALQSGSQASINSGMTSPLHPQATKEAPKSIPLANATSEKTSSSIVLLVLVIAATCLLWVLLRRRS